MTTFDAAEEQLPKIFVPLFHSVFETNGNEYISYQPKSKKSDYKKGYPVGIGTHKENWENEYGKILEYDKAYRVSLANNDDTSESKGDIILTLKEATDEAEKDVKTIYLYRNERDGKISFVAKKDGKPVPKEINGEKYFISVFENTKPEKQNDLLLILDQAKGGSTQWSWAKKGISFASPTDTSGIEL